MQGAGMTQAVLIRDAIFDRLETFRPYAKTRKTPVPQLQPDQLPALSVFVLSGRAVCDGEGNLGAPRLNWSDTIGISVARGFNDTVLLEGQLDDEADAIIERLLTDPQFVRNPGALAKDPSEVWVAGQTIYWNETTRVASNRQLGPTVGRALAATVNPSNTGNVGWLFESVDQVTRRTVFPQDGETYFAELRIELTFLTTRREYPPIITDDLETIHVISTAFPPDTPKVEAEYDIPVV
jgi:hypothetical protein